MKHMSFADPEKNQPGIPPPGLGFLTPKWDMRMAILLLCMIALVFLVLLVISGFYYGGADNIAHFYYARYCFQHPEFLLNLWGRPVYTLVSAPFAQSGIKGSMLLNVLLGSGAAWVSYLVARQLEIKPSFPVVLFVCLTPLYCIMLFSCLTEILFSFLLVLIIYLLLRNKFIAAALLLSFLPYARMEGFIMIPVFFLYFLLRRKYKAIPFLLVGTLVFTFAGYFYYHDWLWIIHQFPYDVSHQVYKEHGSLWYYISGGKEILGLPLEILFVAGILSVVITLFSPNRDNREKTVKLISLILFPLLVFLFFHSYLYWRAMGSSVGLVRVMASVLPLAAIVSFKGYQMIAGIFRKSVILNFLSLGVTFLLLAWYNFTAYSYPVRVDTEDKFVKQAVDWVQNTGNDKHRIGYTNITVPFFLGYDPNDHTRSFLGWRTEGLNKMANSTIFIWDSHFGPNECFMPLDSFLLNPHFRLINLFRPQKDMLTLSNNIYEVYVFMTVEPTSRTRNREIRDSLLNLMDNKNLHLYTYTNRFDVSREKSTADQHPNAPDSCYRIVPSMEFSPGVTLTSKDLGFKNKDIIVKARIRMFPPRDLQKDAVRLVISLENINGSYDYHALDIGSLNLQPGRWNTIQHRVIISSIRSEDDIIKIYLWNPGQKEFYIDDLKTDAYQAPENE